MPNRFDKPPTSSESTTEEDANNDNDVHMEDVAGNELPNCSNSSQNDDENQVQIPANITSPMADGDEQGKGSATCGSKHAGESLTETTERNNGDENHEQHTEERLESQLTSYFIDHEHDDFTRAFNSVRNSDTLQEAINTAAAPETPSATNGRDPAVVQVEFERAEAEYRAKQATGNATDADDIDFIRKQKEYDAFVRKNAVQDEIDESVFFNDEDEDDQPAFFQEQPKQNTTKKTAAATKSTKNQKNKRATNGVKKPTGRKNKKKAKKVRSQIESLLDHNAMQAAQSNTAADSSVVNFTSKQKKDALKQILASIPEDARKSGKSDKTKLKKALEKFDYQGACKPDGDNGWIIAGMKSSLASYQMMAVSWMREKENSEDKGGIIADTMGLGKTVMKIANIVHERRFRLLRKKPHGTTLIVVPSSLAMQWESEINKHAEGKSGIGIVQKHYSGNRITEESFDQTVKQADVVITTYAEVCKNFPKKEFPVECRTPAEKDAWWSQHYEQNKGPLHQTQWHRIVLDEATAIKNHLSRTAQACLHLRGTYKWLISGTPIHNKLEEFYPYFKFLGVPHAPSMRAFTENFCKPDDEDGPAKLVVVLESIMYRRTHNSTFLGCKLVDLPRPSERVIPVHLDRLHAAMYKVVKDRYVNKINELVRDGASKKVRRQTILVLLLRLRQYISHPLLITEVIGQLLEQEDFEVLSAIIDEEQSAYSQPPAVLKHLRAILQNPHTFATNHATTQDGVDCQTSANLSVPESPPEPQEVAEDPAQNTMATRDGTSTGGAFGLKDNTEHLLKSIMNAQGFSKTKVSACPKCLSKPPKHPQEVSCGHTYCNDCLMQMSHESAAQNRDFARCVVDGKRYTIVQKLQREDANSSFLFPSTLLDGEAPVKKSKKPKAFEVIDRWINENGMMVPSAKTMAIKAQLLNWFDQDGTNKVIIYTHFIGMIRILKRMCELEKWPCVELTGLQNIQRRNHAIKKFAGPETKIMLASIKVGGIGLNLAMANKVIIVDMWWNSCVDHQAFCRSFRRGQERETEMIRLSVIDTIDDRIRKLQMEKEDRIDQVIGERNREKVMDLSTEEIMEMFGDVGRNGKGQPFIMMNEVEYQNQKGEAIQINNDEDAMNCD